MLDLCLAFVFTKQLIAWQSAANLPDIQVGQLMHYRSVFRPGLFHDRTVIITGGGSGIGRCTAHELASLGAAVALLGRKLEKLAAVRAEILAAYAGADVSCHACDIREEECVRETVAAIVGQHGRIDGLFNNAGGQYPAPLKEISQKGWETVIRTNLTGGFLMARECYTQWMEENGGAIVNILADMWNGMPGMGHSGAARAGMLNFTETAACEWAHAGGARQCRGARLDRLVRFRDLSAGVSGAGQDFETQGALATLVSPLVSSELPCATNDHGCSGSFVAQGSFCRQPG